MRKSAACIIAGVILGMSLISCEFPSNAQQIKSYKDVKAYDLSLEDAQLLMRAGWAEAGNQGEDGIWLVMSVIINRTEDPDWPDTIREVVYQENQFTTPADLDDVGVDAHLALARIEKGSICPKIIGFETKKSDKLDTYFIKVFDHRDHQFYVKK